MATFFPRKESETVDTSVYQKPWNLGQVYQVEEKTKESFSSPYNSLVSNWNSNQEVMQLDLSEHNDSTDSVKSVSSSPVHIKLDETSHVPGPFEFQVTSRDDHSRHKKEGSALGVTNMVTEDYKNSHREVERKRRMTISSKIEQLRGLLPSLQQTRKADVVSTLSATVDYMQSTLSENKRLKTQVAKLKEEMRELQEQLKESQSCQQDHSPETALLENKSNSDWFTSQQRLCHSDCHYRGPLKIDYSFPWTRYIPPNACDMRLASPEDLQRSCQILQLLSTVKNCYSFICDIHGHLVWLSNSVKDVLGYQPEDLLGSDVWSLLHPEDLDAVYPIVQTWHEIGFTSSVHLRRKRMDGSYVELNSCFTNLLTSNGEVEGCVCIETLLEGSSDRWLEAVYKMDIDGRFTYACPSVERMTGYRVDEIIGKPYTFNVHMDEQQLILNNLHRILSCFHREEEDMHMSGDRHLENLESVASRLRNKTNQTILTWFRRVSKDGNDIWLVSLTVASLDKQTGQPNGFVSIEHDITMHVQRWASVLSEMAMRE